MTESRKSIKWLNYIWPYLVLLLCELFFFRNVIGSDLLFGDDGDGRFCTIVAEHWYQVLKGQHSFGRLGIFYPIDDTIAYSDMLLGYAPVYCVLRFMHFNMFAAYKWTLILIHAVGSVLMYGMLNVTLRVRKEWALIATASFSFSSVYAFIILHTQLAIISLLPALAWCMILFVKAVLDEKRWHKNVYACLSITLMAVLMYTGWYIAFFVIIFLLFYLAAYVLVAWIAKKKAFWAEVIVFLRKIGKDIWWYIGYTVLILLPFIRLYIPVLQMSGGRDYSSIVCYIPQLIDLINVTPDNLCMGWMFDALHLGERTLTGEVWEGYSLVCWALFIGMSILGMKVLKHKKDMRILMMALVLAIGLSLLFTIQIGEKGISLWYLIYRLMPGAGSIRAVGRYLFVLLFPVSVLIGVMGSIGTGKWLNDRRMVYNICVLAAFVLLFVSNITKGGVAANWSETEQLAFLDEVSSPPTDCETVFVVNPVKEERASLFDQLDAMEIAAYYSLGTINGYSGIFPKDFAGIDDVRGEHYIDSVSRWIHTYNLTNVYAYDLTQHIWIKID